MPSVREVLIANLSTPLACPVCGVTAPHPHSEAAQWSPIAVRAALIEAALIEYGHVRGPNHPITDADLHAAAVALSMASRHARYEGDGVIRLRESVVDVDVAYHAALKHTDDPQERADLARWRKLLLDALRTDT